MVEAPRSDLPPWLDRNLRLWLRRKQVHELAMMFAMVPLLIPVPATAIATFGMLVWRTGEFARLFRLWGPALAVATVNIILSAWILSELSEYLWRALIDWWPSVPVNSTRPEGNGGGYTEI